MKESLPPAERSEREQELESLYEARRHCVDSGLLKVIDRWIRETKELLASEDQRAKRRA
jgi:hypothetical protein